MNTASPAHGREIDYPAQLKPLLEPQLLLVEILAPPAEFLSDAIEEIFLRVF